MAETPIDPGNATPIEPTQLNYGPALLPIDEYNPSIPSYTPRRYETGASISDQYEAQFGSLFQDIGAKQDYFKQAAPVPFNAEALNFDRYATAWDFDSKGFIPWRDNESVYNYDTNFLKEMYRSTAWAAPLFGEGFVSGLRTFPDLIEGMFNGDLGTVFSTDDYLGDRWSRAIRMSQSSAGGLSSFFTGLEVSLANMAGTLVEMGVENAVLGYVTAQTGGGAAPVQVAANAAKGPKLARAFKSIYESIRNIGKIADIFKEAQSARRAYQLIGQGLTKTAKFLNPLENTLDFAKTVRAGDTFFTEASALGKGVQGFGAFYRDLREVNFALTEAKLEGAFNKLERRDELVRAFMAENNNVLPSGEAASRIEESVNDSGDLTAKMNLPVIYYSNRLGFGNMFKQSKTLNKLIQETTSDNIFKNIRFNDAAKIFEEASGMTLRGSLRKGTGATLNYFQTNLMEGVQESLQEVISGAAKDYYDKRFNNPTYGGLTVMMGDIANQFGDKVFSGQGFNTFAGGFIMGGMIAPFKSAASGVQNLTYRLTQPEKYAEFQQMRKEQTQRYVNILNEIYKDPLKYFDPQMMDAVRQAELGKYLARTAKDGNQREFQDIKDQAVYEHLYTLVRSGKSDILIDRLNEFKQLQPEEFKDALGHEVENPEDFQTYIDHQVSKVKRIQELYDRSEGKLKNPVNLQAYEKGTDQYNDAAIRFMAFENARQQAIFANYSFERNAERMTDLLGRMQKENKVFTKSTSYLDYSVMMDDTLLTKEMDLLQKEIAQLNQGDADAKQLAAQKEKTLKTLSVWRDSMYSEEIKKGGGRFPADYPSADNPAYENWRRAAKLAFEAHVETVAGLNKDSIYREGVDSAFELMMDYHTLNQQSPSLVEAVNILADPKNFLGLYEGHYTFMKERWARKVQGIADAITQALQITDQNNLINKMVRLGFIEDPEVPGSYWKFGAKGLEKVEPESEDYKKIQDLIEDDRKATEDAKKAEEKKKKEAEEKKAKESKKPEAKKPEGKKPAGKQEKKTEKTEEEQIDEEGNMEVRQDYINPVFKMKPRSVNYSVTLNDDGSIKQIVWNYVGSKQNNIETKVSTLEDFQKILELRTMIDYLKLLAKSYKPDVKYNRDTGYSGVVPALFSATDDALLLKYLPEEQENMEFYTTDERVDDEDLTKEDLKAMETQNRKVANDLAIDLQKILNKTLTEMAANKKVEDNKFIKNSTNTVKVFTLNDSVDNMREAVFTLTEAEINDGATVTIKRVKPKEPVVVYNETKNGVRYKVYRQNPTVESALYVNGNRVGYPTYMDVYIYEIDGEKKMADELTEQEFRAFALPGVSYQEFLNNYNNSREIYLAMDELLGEDANVTLSNEQVKQLMTLSAQIGDYNTIQGEKFPLKDLETGGVKLLGIVDKNNMAEISAAGDSVTAIQENRKAVNTILATINPETRFASQGRYIAVYQLPNGTPAFVEVKSADLSTPELDTVFADIAAKLEDTFTNNVYMEEGMQRAKNKDYNRGFDNFSEESGRSPFYVALAQDRLNPDALSYSVQISVTADGQIRVNFDNTRSAEKDWNKIYVPVSFDAQGKPQVEDFTDLLSRINEAIVNYNQTEGKELPTLTAANFKASIPKNASFSVLQAQQTNVAPGIFKNTALIMTPSNELLKSVDAATAKSGKPAGAPAPVSTDGAKADVEKEKARITASEFTELKRLAKFFLENPKEPTVSGSVVTRYPALFKAVTDIERGRQEELEGEKYFVKTNAEGLKAAKEFVDRVNAKYDAELAALEGAKPAEPAKKKTGLGLKGLKVERPTNPELDEEDDKEVKESKKKKSSGKSMTDVDAEFRAKKEALAKQYVVNGQVTDIVAYTEAADKLEAEYKEAIKPFMRTKPKSKFKITDENGLSAASIVNIEEFTAWVKKTMGGVVTVEEAEEIGERLLNNQVLVGRFLSYMEQVNGGNQVRGVIQTAAEAAFKYHEAFHAVFTLLLSDQQIDRALSLARYELSQQLKDTTIEQEAEKMRAQHPSYASLSKKEMVDRYLEEYLADRFEDFKTKPNYGTGLKGFIRELFAKILDFISGITGRRTELQRFFKDIDKGKFSNVGIQANRFTNDLALKFGEGPVIEKLKIKYGYAPVETLKGEMMMTPQYLSESDTQRIVAAVVNSFMFRVEQLPEYNKAQVLNSILQDFQRLYQISPRYSNLSIDKADRLRMFRDVFMSAEAREDIKKNADVFLQLMGYGQNLEDEEELESQIDDEGERETTERFNESFNQGGFKSFSKYARTYIAKTVYEPQDEFGNQYLDEQNQEPIGMGVNAGIVYNGMVKLMSGVTTEEKFIQRLLAYRNSGNLQTNAFINSFLNDVGVTEESGYKVTKNPRLFNAIYKPFTLFNVSYRTYIIDPKKKIAKSVRANAKDAASNQYNQWQSDFNYKYQDQLTESRQREALQLLTDINTLLKENIFISEEDIAQTAEKLKRLQQVTGLKIAPEYFRYSVLVTMKDNKQPLTEAQLNYIRTFEGLAPILAEDISEIMRTLQNRENPFITFDEVQVDDRPAGDEKDQTDSTEEEDEEEDLSQEEAEKQAELYEKQNKKGNRSRLMRLAEGNAMFDETVLSSSWLNAEYETVSSHQLPTFHMAFLEDVIKDPQKLAERVQNDPFLSNTWIGQQILSGGPVIEILNRLRIDRIDGINVRSMNKLQDGTLLVNNKLTVNKKDGVVYGSYSDREFLLTNLLMYLEDMEVIRKNNGKEVVTTRSMIRVIESKNTGESINLPVISAVYGKGRKVKLSEEVADILFTEFMAEHLRINQVWQDRTNPNRDIIEGYNSFTGTESLTDADLKQRGLNYRSFQDFLGELAPKMRAKAMSDNPQLNKREKDMLMERFSEYLLGSRETETPGMVDMLIDEMQKAGLVGKVGNRYINRLLPAELFGISKTTDRMGRLFLGEDFRANMAQVLISNYLNTRAINQLYHGDEAVSLKDFVDSIKRAAGSNASGMHMATDLLASQLGITHSHHQSAAFTHIDPTYEGKFSGDSKQKQADAQTWSTVKTARYNSFGLGRLDAYKAGIFDKLERGVPLTAEEIFGINGTVRNNAQLKVEKLVYFDGQQYIKTSVLFLTKEFTSMLKPSAKRQIEKLLESGEIAQAHAMQRNNENWVAIPGKELLHTKRVEMEKYEQENNTTVYSFPESASKMMRRNVMKSLTDFTLSKANEYTLDNRYMRLQLENTTNKGKDIVDSTQMITIIDTEQNPRTEVTFRGETRRMGEILDDYQQALADKARISFIQTRNTIFSVEDGINELQLSIDAGKLTPRLAKFQKDAIERSLKQTGATDQLLEFFSVETDPETGEETPVYDLNHPLTRLKFEQLFLSYFRKGTLSQRVPGEALTLGSSWGVRTMRRATRIENGRVVAWDYVREKDIVEGNREFRADDGVNRIPENATGEIVFYKNSPDQVTEVGEYFLDELRHNVPVYDGSGKIVSYRTEFIMPHMKRETMEEIEPGGPIPEALLENFGIRFPAQDKHSATTAYLIDFAPAHMGSVAFFPKEVLEIAGEDNDVDKKYTQFADYYIKRKANGEAEFIRYGSETEDAGRFMEFLLWNFNNNRALKDQIREIKDADPQYQKLADVLDKLYKAKDNLLKDKSSLEEFRDDLTSIDNVITVLSKPVSEENMELEEGKLMSEYDYKKLKGDTARFIADRILNLDAIITDVVNDIRRVKGNNRVVQRRINQIKREKMLLDRLIQFQAMEQMGMPTDTEAFLDFEDMMGGEVNIGAINNFLLDARIAMLSNSYQQEIDPVSGVPRAFEVADQKAISELEQDEDLKDHVKQDSNVDNDNLIGMLYGYRNNKEGSRNIGSVVNGQMANTFLMKNKVAFREQTTTETGEPKGKPIYILEIDGVRFDNYAEERLAAFDPRNGQLLPDYRGRRKMNSGSAKISVMTDNAKDRRAAKFNLNINAAAIAMDMTGRGVPDKLIMAMMLNRAVEKYYNRVKEEGYAVSGKDQPMSRRQIGAEIMEDLVKKAGANAKVEPLTTKLLLDGLSNPSALSDLSIFSHFLSLEAQNRAFSTLSQILKMTKGPTAKMEDWDQLVQNAYDDLGIGMSDEEFAKSDIPYDVRNLVLKQNPLVSVYWSMNKELHDTLGKTVMITRSNLFKTATGAVMNQLKVPRSLEAKVKARLSNQMIVYFALRAYITRLKARGDEMVELLDNNLVYGTEVEQEDISDIIREARRKNPDNFLLNKYLRLTPKTVLQGAKEIRNQDNKSNINILEPTVYGNTDAYLLQKVQNSFIDLLQSDRKTALALFAYSIVKDATLFSPNSIMHVFPTFMFNELIGEIMFDVRNIFRKDNLAEYLSQGRKSRDFALAFGGTFKKVVGDFIQGYLSHVDTKYYLKDFRISADTKDKTVKPVRFTLNEETGKISKDVVIIDLFSGVKPKKIKYKKNKNTEDDDESNYEGFKLDKKGKNQLKSNIQALKDTYKIYVNRDNEGNLGMVLPYAFKIKRNGRFELYVLQNVSRIKGEDQLESADLEDRLTDQFNIVAPRAVYKRVDSTGVYGTTPIGELFGPMPTYTEIVGQDVAREKRESRESKRKRRVVNESDLDISSPDAGNLERPTEDDEQPKVYKRDVSFLKSKGITVSVSNGEFVYKKGGKTYKFEGTPAELAEMLDTETSLGRTQRKTAGKKIRKVEPVTNDEITTEMVEEALEGQILEQTHFDGKAFVRFRAKNGKPKIFGNFRSVVEGLSAVQLIQTGKKTEILIDPQAHEYVKNQLFVIEDGEQKSPSFGKQILVRATSNPATPDGKSYKRNSGWEPQIWEERKTEIFRSGQKSLRIEYIGEIVDGELQLEEGSVKPATPKTDKTAPAAVKKFTLSGLKFDRDAARKASEQEAADDPETQKELKDRDCTRPKK